MKWCAIWEGYKAFAAAAFPLLGVVVTILALSDRLLKLGRDEVDMTDVEEIRKQQEARGYQVGLVLPTKRRAAERDDGYRRLFRRKRLRRKRLRRCEVWYVGGGALVMIRRKQE